MCNCKSNPKPTAVKQVVKKIRQPKPTSKVNKKVSTIRKVVYRRPM